MEELKTSVEVKVLYSIDGEDKKTEVFLDGVKRYGSSDLIEGNGWDLNDVSIPLMKALYLKGNIYNNLKEIESAIARAKESEVSADANLSEGVPTE